MSKSLPLKWILPNGHTTSNPHRFDIDITLIRWRPNFDEFPRHFRVLSSCNFDGRKIHVISTHVFRSDLDGQKSTLSPRTFLDVISMVKKFTLFPRTLFDVISMVKRFPRTFFNAVSLVKICTLFSLTFFDVILMDKNSTSFLVSCKLMKTFEEVFPVFVTLTSWLWQDCSL